MNKRPMTAGQMRAAAGVPEAYPPEPYVPKRYPFNPDYCVAPGVTLREWREEIANPGQVMSTKVAASLCYGMPVAMYEAIEAGEQRIDDEIAMKLESGTRIPAFLWLNLELHYRQGLAEGKKNHV